MGIWIGDWDESVPAWRRLGQYLMPVVVLLGLGLCIQTYSEDEVSHSIKVRFPLFFGAEWLIDRTADYDPKTARWGAVNRAVMVEDGEVVFVRSGKVVYAVKMLRQTLEPELGEYAYLTVGTDAPIVHGRTQPYPGGLIFPGLTIPWSGIMREWATGMWGIAFVPSGRHPAK